MLSCRQIMSEGEAQCRDQGGESGPFQQGVSPYTLSSGDCLNTPLQLSRLCQMLRSRGKEGYHSNNQGSRDGGQEVVEHEKQQASQVLRLDWHWAFSWRLLAVVDLRHVRETSLQDHVVLLLNRPLDHGILHSDMPCRIRAGRSHRRIKILYALT